MNKKQMERNADLIEELKEYFVKHQMTETIRLYGNGKVHFYEKGKKPGWKEEATLASNYMQFHNDDKSVAFSVEDGIFYDVLDQQIIFFEEFIEIIEKYGYMYERGTYKTYCLYDSCAYRDQQFMNRLQEAAEEFGYKNSFASEVVDQMAFEFADNNSYLEMQFRFDEMAEERHKNQFLEIADYLADEFCIEFDNSVSDVVLTFERQMAFDIQFDVKGIVKNVYRIDPNDAEGKVLSLIKEKLSEIKGLEFMNMNSKAVEVVGQKEDPPLPTEE